MQVAQRLELKQSQQLVMTPQLQQAIKLLQMSSLDAAGFIAEEIERNPILAVDDGSAEVAAPASERGEPAADGLSSDDPAGAEAAFDTGVENLYEAAEAQGVARTSDSFSSARTGEIGRGGDWAEGGEGFESRLAGDATLRDHLLPQIALSASAPAARLLAARLVDELDEAGYLRADAGEIAVQLGGSDALAREALAALQACEPTGVGARDLGECLALQLKEKNRFDPAMERLLGRLDDLGAMRLNELRAACGVSREDLVEMIAEIRALNPRPGAPFTASVAQTVAPDVFVRRNGVGGWSVEVNADALPKVLLDTAYAAELTAAGEPATKRFVGECRQNADWLIQALDQRAQTILKVATEITRRQAMFFAEGVEWLSPMTLRMVAEEIGMHESTVSRVTANKYLACERGLFEMKFFFTTALGAETGSDAVSAAAVRHQIKRLVAGEEPGKVLSDDQIVARLKENGVRIARRTVAKYRDALNIPSSARRKRLNAASSF